MIKWIIGIILLLTIAPIVLACLITLYMWMFDSFCNFIALPVIEFVCHLFGM